MNARRTLALALCLSTLGACRMTGEPAKDRVDDSLISELAEPQMQEIRELRIARDHEKDDLARAERDLAAARELVQVAKTELSAGEERLKAAEARIDTARAHGTTQDLENAQQLLGRAQLDLETVRNKVRWREQQVSQAEALVELSRERVALAEAQLELTKAQAVSQLDRPRARLLDLEVFERRLREQQTLVQIAEVKASAALEEVNRVEASYQRTREDLQLQQQPREQE
jgi:hypothetical protein